MVIERIMVVLLYVDLEIIAYIFLRYIVVGFQIVAP